MKVIEYLKEHSLEELEELGCNITKYPDYFVLNYNQISGDKYDPILRECRALVLDYNLNVLCRSFDRFYNYGEDPKSNDFRIDLAETTSKLDGSAIQVWWNPYLERWNVSTRKMAHAEGETKFGNTFWDLALKAFNNVPGFIDYPSKNILGQIFDKFSKDLTFIFEVTSPENRIVTRYSDYKLWLLAIRDKEGNYHSTDCLKDIFTRPPRHTFNNIESIMKAAKELPTLEEGYVCNWNNWRIKVKNPSYLAVAHLRQDGNLSIKSIVTLVMSNDEEEYLQYFQEDRQFFIPYIEAREKAFELIDKLWNETKDIVDQKEFALKVKDYPVASFLFALRRGKKKEDVISNMTINAKINLLEGMKNE